MDSSSLVCTLLHLYVLSWLSIKLTPSYSNSAFEELPVCCFIVLRLLAFLCPLLCSLFLFEIYHIEIHFLSISTSEQHTLTDMVNLLASLTRDIKQRQAAQTPNVVFVVASHYQSLQIEVLLLQACLFGIMALSRTLLLQQLQ